MLNPLRRFASGLIFFAVAGLLGTITLLADSAAEPLYYVYHGEQKVLTLDTQSVAIHLNASVPSQSAVALSQTLTQHGFNSSDVIAEPGAGWLILNAKNALSSST